MYKHVKPTLLALSLFATGCSILPTSDDYTGGNANTVAANAGANGQSLRECRWAGASGTKMRTRICHSQEEWARIDARNDPGQDTEAFFRRQREQATVQGNIDPPDIR